VFPRLDPEGVEYDRGPKDRQGLENRLGGRVEGALKMSMRIVAVMVVMRIGRVGWAGLMSGVIPADGATENVRMSHHLMRPDT
jgi:hypothetical protein